MKKVGFTLIVAGLMISNVALANDCPFHDKSARDKNVKSQIYNSKTTKNVGPSSQGADGAVNESSKKN